MFIFSLYLFVCVCVLKIDKRKEAGGSPRTEGSDLFRMGSNENRILFFFFSFFRERRPGIEEEQEPNSEIEKWPAYQPLTHTLARI